MHFKKIILMISNTIILLLLKFLMRKGYLLLPMLFLYPQSSYKFSQLLNLRQRQIQIIILPIQLTMDSIIPDILIIMIYINDAIRISRYDYKIVYILGCWQCEDIDTGYIFLLTPDNIVQVMYMQAFNILSQSISINIRVQFQYNNGMRRIKNTITYRFQLKQSNFMLYTLLENTFREYDTQF